MDSNKPLVVDHWLPALLVSESDCVATEKKIE